MENRHNHALTHKHTHTHAHTHTPVVSAALSACTLLGGVNWLKGRLARAKDKRSSNCSWMSSRSSGKYSAICGNRGCMCVCAHVCIKVCICM